MRWRTVALTLALVSLAVGSAGGTSASQAPTRQTEARQEDVLPALLVEVRGLRAAMEELASAGPRVQLALGRVQLQEQRVNTLMRRVEEGRTRLADAQRTFEGFQQNLRSIEAIVRDPQVSAPQLADLQIQQRDVEQQIARLRTEIQRQTSEEALIEADLATEQSRWVDLNQRMEALEQSLVRK